MERSMSLGKRIEIRLVLQVDATLWLSPPGLIGPAVNLIRPMVHGQRRTVWWSLLGQTLLFDTGAHAVQYRKICTQVVKASCPNIVALDGSKLMVRTYPPRTRMN